MPSDMSEKRTKPRRTDLSKVSERGAAGKRSSKAESRFWKLKPLEALDKTEWESLCDGCGRCCLVKLEDEETGVIYFTDVTCKLFEADTCRCADYSQRRRKVRDCIKLTPETARSLSWLPPTCAYRLVGEGRDLKWWHPLVSGSAETVHEAGISVRGRDLVSETGMKLEDYPDHIVSWPGKVPRAAKDKYMGKR